MSDSQHPVDRYCEKYLFEPVPIAPVANPGIVRIADRVNARLTPERRPKCPECFAVMRVRLGSKGPFWSCSGFPDCRTTRAIEDDRFRKWCREERIT